MPPRVGDAVGDPRGYTSLRGPAGSPRDERSEFPPQHPTEVINPELIHPPPPPPPPLTLSQKIINCFKFMYYASAVGAYFHPEIHRLYWQVFEQLD
jgi:hypothetical protein